MENYSHASSEVDKGPALRGGLLNSFVCALVGLVAVFLLGAIWSPLAIVGVGLGVYSFVLRKGEKSRGVRLVAPRATLVLAVLAILFGVIALPTSFSTSSEIGVSLNNAGVNSGGSVVVHMDGALDSGDQRSEDLAIESGKVFLISDAAPGAYVFSVEKGALQKAGTVYKLKQEGEEFRFEGKRKLEVKLELVVDEEATAALKKAEEEKKQAEAEEKRKAEEEAKQKAEEERKAKEAQEAEEKAAAAAAAEQKRQEQAQSSGSGRMVVITENGHSYHLQGCSTLNHSKNLSSVPIEVAQSKGLEPCGRCKPGR